MLSQLSHAEAIQRLKWIITQGNRLPEWNGPDPAWQSVQSAVQALAAHHSQQCFSCRAASPAEKLRWEAAWTILERKNYPMVAIAAPTLMP